MGIIRVMIAGMICLFALATGAAVDYDPNDFAVEVVEYVQGSGVLSDWISGEDFNDPNRALGAPTSMTTRDPFWPYDPNDPNGLVPVVPVYPAFRASELVSVGNGGYLILKFSHPVANDRNNPYGMDFIIYGNARQDLGGSLRWMNGNPEQTNVLGTIYEKPGIVSVSHDGVTWHTFESGPFANSFAPTAGFRWDSQLDQWAEQLDPTRPVPPGIDVAGMTVAEMIDVYEGSAGGTAFDIAELGMDWILYVMISDDPEESWTTQIDAVADVSACGDYRHSFPVGDITYDCRVDMADLAAVAEGWLRCTWDCD
jgi:hypothetical protein